MEKEHFILQDDFESNCTLVLEDSAVTRSTGEMAIIRSVDQRRVPVLVVWGKKDSVIPIEAARFLHSEIKNSELVVFEYAGHIPHWEQPEDFNNVVGRFLSSQKS